MVGDTIQERYGLIVYYDIWYDSVTRNRYSNVILPKNRGKENAYLCTVVEEVKHWEKNWYTELHKHSVQGLHGLQTQTESLSFPWCFLAMICHYLKQRCWCSTHAQNVREWTAVMFETIYNYNYEKYFHITMFDVWNTRWKFFMSIQSNFASENDFRSTNTRRTIWYLPVDIVGSYKLMHRYIDVS